MKRELPVFFFKPNTSFKQLAEAFVGILHRVSQYGITEALLQTLGCGAWSCQQHTNLPLMGITSFPMRSLPPSSALHQKGHQGPPDFIRLRCNFIKCLWREFVQLEREQLAQGSACGSPKNTSQHSSELCGSSGREERAPLAKEVLC